MDVIKKKNKLREFLNRAVILLGVGITLIGGMFFFQKITGADFYIVAMAQSEGQENSLLTEQKPVGLKLNKRKDTDNVAFQVSNMFPGDVVLGNYCVKVSYKEIATVGFRVDIGKGYDKLAEVLKCKIVLSDTDELLYDGLMKDVPKALEQTLPYAEKGEVELCYQISAYLDTSVGNTYQNTSLEADFVWWLQENRKRIDVSSLTIVPEGLKDTAFSTVEKIKSELSRILILSGGSEYNVDNMEFYDVNLQFWNGTEWIDATEDNFPLEGINVTLPYPKGTGQFTHDFIVSHMFTINSERLGIKAGEVEYPPVTKTEEGLNVTFKGLSPVAVAWKKLETSEDVPDAPPEGEHLEGNISGNNTFTGDTTPITSIILLMLSSFGGLFILNGIKQKHKEYRDE